MSILNVNKINPVGGGSTITIAGIASVTNNISVGNSVTAGSFVGPIEGNVTGNLTGTASTSTNAATAYAIDSAASLNTSGIVTATSFVPTVGQLSHRNLLINGDMRISQRNTTQSSIASGTHHVLDRWGIEVTSGGGAQVTMSQDNQAPEGFSKSLKIDVTTADTSLGGGERWQVRQRIEGQDLRRLKYGTSNALQCTFSFFVRSNVTGTFAVGLYQQDGNKINSGNYTINSADTWEKKTIIINGNTADAMNDDNTLGFQVGIGIAAGTSYTSGTATGNWSSSNNTQYPSQTNLLASTSNELFFTGCQLEVGPVATPFEHEAEQVTFLKCQRYFQYWYNAVRFPTTSSVNHATYHFPTPMRAAPTVVRTGDQAGSYESGSTTALMVGNSQYKYYYSGLLSYGNGSDKGVGGYGTLDAEL